MMTVAADVGPGSEAKSLARAGNLKVANFMDSSLLDLEKKGVLANVPDIYNPDRAYASVFHFTPHERDLELGEFFAPHGIKLVHHPSAWLSPIRFIRSLSQAMRLFRTENVDLVRGRLPYLGSLVGGVAARLCGLPFVVSLGGDNRIVQERNRSYNYDSRRISYGMEWLVLKLAHRVIVPNRFTQSYVEDIIGRRGLGKCAHIPWLSTPVPEFVDDDETILAELSIPPGSAIVPIVGFLNPYKFTDVLFDAVDNLNLKTADGRNVCFCFCGDGPLREEGEARFAGKPNIKFLGWQESAVVHTLLRQAEMVLIPMSGFVLLEAASIGKPVVTSNVEWHTEMVESGRSGLAVDPHDPQAWRSAIEQMLADAGHALELGERLKELYWREYAPQRCKDAEVDLYLNLTGSRMKP